MNQLPVYTYNHPILRQKATPVTEMNEELQAFIADMKHTMRGASGIGLAANQVGSPLAIAIVMDPDAGEYEDVKEFAIINPTVESFSEEVSEQEEGCLSLPGYHDMVVRPASIQVRYFNEQMQEVRSEVTGMLARVMQHEIDHLNGIYFFDKLTPVRRAMGHHKLKRIERGTVQTDYPLFKNTEEKRVFRRR